MKKFLSKSCLFFMGLLVADRTLGMVFSYMADNAKGGYIGHHKYVTDKVGEDILVFGSSRAIHHYNPQIISDSLGLSCYNCGQDGNGIILFYGLWQMIKEHHKPKMIIYDVNTDFDLYEGESNQRYLGWLRMDYDRPGIKSIFTAVEPTERYKMMSMLYRHNSKFMQILTDYVHPIFKIKGNGFLPLRGKMDKMKIRTSHPEQSLHRADSLKLEFIGKLIDDTYGVSVVFVASPSWYNPNPLSYKPIMDLCKKRGIEFIDYSGDKDFVRNDCYFKDGSHLNSIGADVFTKKLVSSLKKI